jgi:hypothetical protein
VENLEEGNIPWALPIGTHKLVRVSKGNEDYSLRDQHSLYTSKLLELSGNTSEVLLLRCLRKRGAKSVYIPINRNGNQRRSAIITFASEKEMKTAQTKPIRFNNHLLFWQGETKKRKQSKEEEEEFYEKCTTTHDINIDLNAEVHKNKSNREEEDTEGLNENKKKHRIHLTTREDSQT